MEQYKQYIRTELVTAKPMSRGAYCEFRGWEVPKDENAADEGYLVVSGDNYETWTPRWVFDAACLELSNNPYLKTDKPSISQEMVDNFIVGAQTMKMGEKTTVVRAVCRNGFDIVLSSSCVSAENYSEEMGRKICMKNIEKEVWHLLGFLLQTAVSGVAGSGQAGDTCGQPAADGMDFGAAIRAVKAGKRIARAGWNGKGQFVELASCIGYRNPEEQMVNAEHLDIGNRALAFVGTRGVQLGWLASQSDMLAEDWQIVE